MDETAFQFFADQLKTWSLYQIKVENNRIVQAIKGWDQYPFGECQIQAGRRMLDLIEKERRRRYVKTYRKSKKERTYVRDQEGSYPDW
jgi:hypothetical protein